ncbi:MAG: murein hydrolase activator EnvC family protein [Thermodesulfovibrionales bacterium]
MSKEYRAKSMEQKTKRYIFLYLLSLLLALSTLLYSSHCLSANPQEEYKKIQKEIKEHKEKIRKAERRETSILSELERTDRELSIVEAELRKYRKKLMETEREISRVESEILKSKKSIEQQKEWIKRKLRAMHKNRCPSEVVILLSGTDDLSSFMRRWKYLQYISSYENKLLLDYRKKLDNLNTKERQLLDLKAELTKNEAKIRSDEEELEKKKREKEIILASVRNEKSSYEKMLKELKEASRRLLNIIRKSEKSDTYTAKGFTALKGKLPWPVEGRVAIPYGTQKDPVFNTPIFRSGIFIQAGEDLYAKAVHTGKVVFAEWFKGYGQLMIVNHGDGYHTLYGSLSEIFSKVGDIINSGQIIGRVGNSGIVDVPGLYFELRYKGKPLDPLQWLKRK